MDFPQGTPKNKKSSPLILSVLNTIPKSQLKQQSETSNELSLFIWTPKKMVLAAYRTSIPKSKLLSNLEIYEWRHQTEFPIIKTVSVHVQQNTNPSSSHVQLIVYNEHCPIKISQLFDITLSKSIYILKESMLGFQRLYTRFGCFEISESMIGINEKGFCRVWLNQNFGLNCIAKKDSTENKMVSKLINILESRTQQSKLSKKLFNILRGCSNFYSTLKSIQLFIKESRMIISTKYLLDSHVNQNSRFEFSPLAKHSSPQIHSPKIAPRLSIKGQKFRQLLTDEFKSSIKQRKNSSSSPLKMKRLKSEKEIIGITGTLNQMKVSDLETQHTRRRNRTPNADLNTTSPQKNNIINEVRSEKVNQKKIGWIEQSSYLMGEEESPLRQPQRRKKQLTQSEAIIFDSASLLHSSERKYSCKLINVKNENFAKKTKNQELTGELDELFYQSPKQLRKTKRIEEVDEDKFREQVSGSVLKNNGWVAKVSGLLDIPSNLETSFHEGMEQNISIRDMKLGKIDKIGRQHMLTSILQQNV